MKTPPSPPGLSLAVQYATSAPSLERWRLRRWVQRALAGGCADLAARQQPVPTTAEFTLRLVDAEEGAELNETWRQSSGPTNVLTFTYDDMPATKLLADIVLCVPVIEAEARHQDKVLHHHAAHLVTHGVLHALGYDHDTDEQARIMETLESQLLATAGIPEPYQTSVPPASP